MKFPPTLPVLWIAACAVALVSGAVQTARADLNEGVIAFDRSDHATALREISEAARRGEPIAQHLLGWMHDTGWGVVQNRQTAMRWYRKAAEQGDRISQFILGTRYAAGLGVPRDRIEAYMWYYIAGLNGDRQARDLAKELEESLSSGRIAKARARVQDWMRKHRE